jgi:hypothetical protein
MLPKRTRDNFFQKMVDDIKMAMSAPDFWPMFCIYFVMMVIFILFFWMALGFDVMARLHGRWQGACRKLGDWQSLVLFVSPFAISLSSMLAAGEFISQLERWHRYRKPMKWVKVVWTFALATGMLSVMAVLMIIWC